MKRKLSQKHLVSLCTITILLLVLAIWTIWGNTALMVNTITIASSRIPPAFSGFRIAQVSDLHNAEFGKDNSELLQMLSKTMPDIIVITGDLVDAQHTDMDIALNFVNEAAQIAPIYYVTGNHEASLPQYDKLRTGLEKIGAAVLEDKAIQVRHNGEKITLIGLSDPDFTIKGDMFGEVPVMANTKLKTLADPENSYTVLLSHQAIKFVTSGVGITGNELVILIVGSVVAFLVSVAAIRFLLDYVRRHDFALFGYYRIILGAVVLIYFLL